MDWRYVVAYRIYEPPIVAELRKRIKELESNPVLPYEVVIGVAKIGKGVALKNLVAFAERMYSYSQRDRKKLDLAIEALTNIADVETFLTSKNPFATENSVEFDLGQFDKCREEAQQTLQKIAELEGTK